MYFEYITEDKDRSPSEEEILNEAALNMEPELQPQPKLFTLNESILLRVARANVLSQITVLNLHGNSLSKIKEISSLTALRRLTISFNKLTCLDDISHMPNLEILDASFNEITTLEGLRRLARLKQLDVSWNRLTKAREDTAVLRKHSPALLKLDTRHNPWNKPETVKLIILSRFTTLTHLDGEVVKEEEASEAVHMAAASKINQASRKFHLSLSSTSEETRFLRQEISIYLKGLTNLIILDLYRNPIVEKLENYRIYVIFHLPSLKALDGIAVDLSECESAKHMFRGRLTSDTVAEKLGHSNYAEVTYLSLQSCSIRMVDLSPPDLFCNLLSINLERNNLTSFSGIIHLPHVKVLCLNHNHIESILPRHRTQTHLTNRQVLHSKVHSSGYGQQSSSKGHRDTGPTGSLEPLMASLEVLHLSHNSISNMANLQLSRLTNLKALFLQGNDISQVEGLEGLQQLRELVLNRNRIKTLTKNSFAAQTVLLELHLAENRIRELNHLDPLIELRKLSLDMNKLQDIAELEKLEVLPSLTELSIVGNPVARNSLHRPAVVLRLNQLQVLDGMMVTLEERTRAELLNEESLQTFQFYGAPLPTAEMSFHALLPVLPHKTTLRGVTLSGGPQNFMHVHDFGSDKKQRNSSFGPAATNFRHNQNTGSNLLTTQALFDGNTFIIPHGNQEQDSRHGGKPPPM
uniref:Leucine rich repeat containing 9 n=1 Tax=Iconisemion striatum TaxID=60296 RepID=A0A1A7XEU2_9TELE